MTSNHWRVVVFTSRTGRDSGEMLDCASIGDAFDTFVARVCVARRGAVATLRAICDSIRDDKAHAEELQEDLSTTGDLSRDAGACVSADRAAKSAL